MHGDIHNRFIKPHGPPPPIPYQVTLRRTPPIRQRAQRSYCPTPYGESGNNRETVRLQARIPGKCDQPDRRDRPEECAHPAQDSAARERVLHGWGSKLG